MAASRPVWGAWIEMSQFRALSSSGAQSRPVWGAWIEIHPHARMMMNQNVAPRMGRVD